MSQADLAKIIDEAFERRDRIDPSTKGAVREAVEAALDLLDRGVARVAERGHNGDWRVNQRLKKGGLLSFRLHDNSGISGGARETAGGGKGASKIEGGGGGRVLWAGLAGGAARGVARAGP